jgi:hypothetical protein
MASHQHGHATARLAAAAVAAAAAATMTQHRTSLQQPKRDPTTAAALPVPKACVAVCLRRQMCVRFVQAAVPSRAKCTPENGIGTEGHCHSAKQAHCMFNTITRVKGCN